MTEPPFEPVSTELDFPSYERRILALWKERGIFEKSLAAHADGPHFVFYEGPPTANGVPHNGHVLTRVVKDLFPRYQAMQGKRVLRKGGWDTHGLPVEVEVEKELRIHGKAAIQEYGVEPFVARCIESVFRYTNEWEKLTERIGFWVSLPDAYVTYHRSYVESVWWALSNLFDKGLLYQGHKVVWWWAQGGTALSSGEVGLGYKTVDDPSVYVAFPLVDDPETALAVWTTTPWTLSSNGYAAVRATYSYDVVRLGAPKADPKAKKGKKPVEPPELTVKNLIVASELRETLEGKLGRELEVVRTVKGSELVGTRYRPPFDLYYSQHADTTAPLKDGGETHIWWRVIAEDFVTLDSGTGIVHIAPAFGEDDNKAHKKELQRYQNPDEVELICAVNPDGTFKPEAAPYDGRWVKDADKDILRELEQKKLLVHHELYRHDYPFCWRADQDPLIQMARPAWFIRTTRAAEGRHRQQPGRQLAARAHQERPLRRLPRQQRGLGAQPRALLGHAAQRVGVHEGRGAQARARVRRRDREAQPGRLRALERVEAANPELSEHLIVHKPWIDHVTFPCPKCGAEMRRVPEVIDCWFDSGCMPFAQWGYPHAAGSKERFNDAFPADFISEAIDQTRGWFYSLLDDLDARLRQGDAGKARPHAEARVPVPVQDLHRARPRLRQGGQEGEQEQGQLHAARDHPRPRAHGVRRARRRARHHRQAGRGADRARGSGRHGSRRRRRGRGLPRR